MSICGKISKSQTFNCDAPMTGGAKDRVGIINFEDIDTLTRSNINPQIIRAVTLKSGKAGYRWEGPPNTVIASAKLVRGKFKNKYEQIVGLPLLANNSDLKEQLEKGAYGKFIVFVENNHQVGDATFEIYFIEKGGIITKNERDIVNADLEGGYDINFGQEDAFREGHLPATFAVLTADATPVYSYALTLAAFDSLFPVV